MALTARKIINADTIYTFLEDSFYQVYNSMKEQNLVDNQNINFQIYRSQADFDGTINVPYYADEEESKKKDFGLIKFLTGQVDPSRLSNVFSHSYAFEMLAFESHREDVRKIFTSMASTINGNTFQFSDGNGDFTAFATVDEFPTISQTIDANGADKFIISLVFVFLFYQDAVHFNQVYMTINGIRPEFEEISFSRQMVEPAVDMRKNFENIYVPNKSAFGINVSGYYISNGATDSFIRWIMDETKLEDTVRFFYSDGKQIRTGNYMIADANITVPFEAIIQYTLSMLPVKDVPRTYRGIYVKNAEGTGEYLIGANISLSADSSKDGKEFTGWTVEYSTDPNFNSDSLGDAGVENVTFSMPNADIILKANYEQPEVEE